MTTSLVPQAVVSATDLTELLRTLTDAKPDASKAVQPASKPSNTVEVTEGAIKALESLSGLLKAVTVPSGHRESTPDERAEMMALAKTAKDTVPAINAAVDAVKEAIFTHLDVGLERVEFEAERDESGHFLVKGEVYVPEHDMRFTRELREAAPEVTAKGLRQLWQDGKITRKDYFDATQHVEVPREVVPEQLLAVLKKKPELLSVIAKAITPGKVTSAFYVRPPKKGDKKA